MQPQVLLCGFSCHLCEESKTFMHHEDSSWPRGTTLTGILRTTSASAHASRYVDAFAPDKPYRKTCKPLDPTCWNLWNKGMMSRILCANQLKLLARTRVPTKPVHHSCLHSSSTRCWLTFPRFL